MKLRTTLTLLSRIFEHLEHQIFKGWGKGGKQKWSSKQQEYTWQVWTVYRTYWRKVMWTSFYRGSFKVVSYHIYILIFAKKIHITITINIVELMLMSKRYYILQKANGTMSIKPDIIETSRPYYLLAGLRLSIPCFCWFQFTHQ